MAKKSTTVYLMTVLLCLAAMSLSTTGTPLQLEPVDSVNAVHRTDRKFDDIEVDRAETVADSNRTETARNARQGVSLVDADNYLWVFITIGQTMLEIYVVLYEFITIGKEKKNVAQLEGEMADIQLQVEELTTDLLEGTLQSRKLSSLPPCGDIDEIPENSFASQVDYDYDEVDGTVDRHYRTGQRIRSERSIKPRLLIQNFTGIILDPLVNLWNWAGVPITLYTLYADILGVKIFIEERGKGIFVTDGIDEQYEEIRLQLRTLRAVIGQQTQLRFDNLDEDASHFEEETGHFDGETGHFEYELGHFGEKTGHLDEESGPFYEDIDHFVEKTSHSEEDPGHLNEEIDHFNYGIVDRDYIDEETDRVDHDVQMMIRRRRDVNSTERIENVERQDFPNLISNLWSAFAQFVDNGKPLVAKFFIVWNYFDVFLSVMGLLADASGLFPDLDRPELFEGVNIQLTDLQSEIAALQGEVREMPIPRNWTTTPFCIKEGLVRLKQVQLQPSEGFSRRSGKWHKVKKRRQRRSWFDRDVKTNDQINQKFGFWYNYISRFFVAFSLAVDARAAYFINRDKKLPEDPNEVEKEDVLRQFDDLRRELTQVRNDVRAKSFA